MKLKTPARGLISLLHHYFEYHGAGENNVSYMPCVGPNKNNATIQYLESAELSFRSYKVFLGSFLWQF